MIKKFVPLRDGGQLLSRIQDNIRAAFEECMSAAEVAALIAAAIAAETASIVAGLFYQTVTDGSDVAATQRPRLRFGTDFTVTDSSVLGATSIQGRLATPVVVGSAQRGHVDAFTLSKVLALTKDARITDIAVAGILSISGAGGVPAAGLKMWLKADAGVTISGGKVTAWADQSGSGNNFAQANVARQPTFTSGVGNGVGGITFGGNGSAINLKCPSGIFAAAVLAKHIIVVATATNQIGGLGLVAIGDEQYGVRQAGVGNTRIYADGTNVAASMQVNVEPRVTELYEYEFSYAGTPNFIIFSVSGSAYSTNGGPPVSTGLPAPTFVTVGNTSDGNADSWFGHIHEVLMWDHVLSTSDLDDARNYLIGRYGINIARIPLITG